MCTLRDPIGRAQAGSLAIGEGDASSQRQGSSHIPLNPLSARRRLSNGWTKLAVEGAVPAPRGWFAFSGVTGGDEAGGSILIHGGNSPSNERLGDMHMLKLL